MILVTGGAGYIGSHVNKELNKQGYETVIFDNLSAGHKELVKWGTLVIGNLANIDEIAKVFEDYPIEAVLHFAAFTSVGESMVKPSEYYRNNLVCTLNLLDVMRKASVNKIIFSSTAATFGNPLRSVIDEHHPQVPINPYGRTKLMIEHMLADFDRAYGIKYTALRYFNACGADPGGDIGEVHIPETHLIPIILEVAQRKREKMVINGNDFSTPDGTCIRDYVHVYDLATAHLLALKRLLAGENSDVFNLGNGKGFSNKEVVDAVKEVTGINFEVLYGPRREGDPAVLVAGSEKAQQVLGWRPIYTDLKKIIETAWNWQKSHT